MFHLKVFKIAKFLFVVYWYVTNIKINTNRDYSFIDPPLGAI